MMRTFREWLDHTFPSLVVLVALVGRGKREEITRLLAVNSLFKKRKIVNNFSNMNTIFLSAPVLRGDGPTSPLPKGIEAKLPAGTEAWIKERAVTALLVLKNGEIVSENYFQGTKPEDRRIGWSVAKSYISALVGILLDEGAIASIDDPVTKYVPALVGGAYDGTTLRHVLNMSSGVLFDENYLDKNSDINRMGRMLALGGEMDDFAAGLTETFLKPGELWQYVSIDTHVISMVIRGATGRAIPDLLSDKIVSKLGLECEPYYLTDTVGTAFVLGGLNVNTRDHARFGQMFLQGGLWQGKQIVPAAWVTASTTPSAPPAAPTAPITGEFYDYGFQWWIPKDASPREYLARGIYGQYIYINEPENVVIVTNSADLQFRDPGIDPSNVEMFRLITNTL